MKFRIALVSAAIVAVLAMIAAVLGASPASANNQTSGCELGIDGLVRLWYAPAVPGTVSLVANQRVVQEFGTDGSVTLPLANLGGANSPEARRGGNRVATFDISGCKQPSKIDVYVTPGEHNVNNRKWRTTCEPYSQTERCRTEIWATQVNQVSGKFIPKNGWVFNNLTYKASPRSLWKGNPLGELGSWTSADGRQWMTDCDSAETGRNGCRSYILADVIEVMGTPTPGEPWEYGWVNRWVFNNMVRFS